MSFRLQERCWPLSLPSTAKLVLVRLAGFAGDDGASVFPSQERVAAECGLSIRAVRVALRKLEAAGLLMKVRPAVARQNRPAEYRITLPAPAPADDRHEVPPKPVHYRHVATDSPARRSDFTGTRFRLNRSLNRSEKDQRADGADGLRPDGDRLQWECRAAGFERSGYWSGFWGPEPGDAGCKMPRDLQHLVLEKKGARQVG